MVKKKRIVNTSQTPNNLKADYKDLQKEVYDDYEQVSEEDLLTENVDNSIRNDFPQINTDPQTLVNISPEDILKDLNNTVAYGVVNANVGESFGGSLFGGSYISSGHADAK